MINMRYKDYSQGFLTGLSMKQVLFVCVENSCRSQMAEAYGHLYRQQNPQDKITVFSAGSNPSGKVNPRAIEVMAELDYDLNRHQSKALTDVPNTDYAAVITMGCGDNCAEVRAAIREDWPLPDPKHMPLEEFRQVRDEVGQRVSNLLSRLAG
jgi:protein-tyrosine-phosphatase